MNIPPSSGSSLFNLRLHQPVHRPKTSEMSHDVVMDPINSHRMGGWHDNCRDVGIEGVERGRLVREKERKDVCLKRTRNGSSKSKELPLSLEIIMTEI